MNRNERTIITFLLRHLALGAAGGFTFGALLLALDIAGLRTLAFASPDRWLILALLFFGLFVTFGSVGMGVGIMSLGRDEN